MIAELGGVLQMLMLVGTFLCIPISELDMKKKMVNKIFKFNVSDKFKDEFEMQHEAQQELQKLNKDKNNKKLLKNENEQQKSTF